MRNLQSKSDKTSATSLAISWESPTEKPNGYNVTYTVLKVAGVPVMDKKPSAIMLNSSATVIEITALESFTTYQVSVTPITNSRGRMKSKQMDVGN